MASQTLLTESTHRHFKILIADDNEINRLLLLNQLQDRFIDITAVQNGLEALAYIDFQLFDLIFLDLQMPKMTGYELIKKIRQIECMNSQIPVIAITAHAQPSQCQDIINSGFDDCLIKPVTARQLFEIIDLWQPPVTQKNIPLPQSYAQQILQKTAFNQNLAITILEKLIEELPAQLLQIEKALNTLNHEQALEVAHRLHGSVSFCGLLDIQKPALELEKLLTKNHFSTVNTCFIQLQSAVEKFLRSESSIATEINTH